MANLKPHECVVLFLGYCISPICLVMEYLPGGSVESLLHERKKSNSFLSINEICVMSKDIAAGLNHLHSEKIVHRDLAGL